MAGAIECGCAATASARQYRDRGDGWGTGVVVEDIDRGLHDDKALFHLINLAREKGFFVLLTSREVPARVDWTLPDLLSRLNALLPVQIGAPDDPLLKAVMLKHFADRQLDVDPKVLDYLALHIERSLDAAARVVEAVDRARSGRGAKSAANSPLRRYP